MFAIMVQLYHFPVQREYACGHGHFKVSFDTDDFERLFFDFLRESPNLLSYLDFQNKCLVD